jgi:hypothetical protein
MSGPSVLPTRILGVPDMLLGKPDIFVTYGTVNGQLYGIPLYKIS